MKKYFIPALLLSALVIAGCSTSQNADVNNSQNANQPQQQNNQTPQRITNENFSQGGLQDLEIGKKVMVMGTTNTDGTVVAYQVIIANSDADFSQFGPNRNREQSNNGQENPQADDQQPSGEVANRPNFGQFQNLSEEERVQFRAQRGDEQNLTDEQRAQFRTQTGSGGQAGANRQMNRSMSSRLNGEITAKDDTSITLKIQDGSTKLIFVSDATFVDVVKENKDDNISPENQAEDLNANMK
ncbi:MAG: hypothetical protein ABIC82_03090 [bacterium]